MDKAQVHLFKRILGLPTSAADEAVYLLTDLLPISLQILQEQLLLLGQILSIGSERIEYRLLLQGICANTTSSSYGSQLTSSLACHLWMSC